jgi:hypothetical protein
MKCPFDEANGENEPKGLGSTARAARAFGYVHDVARTTRSCSDHFLQISIPRKWKSQK